MSDANEWCGTIVAYSNDGMPDDILVPMWEKTYFNKSDMSLIIESIVENKIMSYYHIAPKHIRPPEKRIVVKQVIRKEATHPVEEKPFVRPPAIYTNIPTYAYEDNYKGN